MAQEIPLTRPDTPLLDGIDTPADLRQLDAEQLPQLIQELRLFLTYTVGRTGGHFGAGLGVVELTVALHYLYNTPYDRLVWDVGHQAYPHKILTQRRELMHSLRQRDGLAAFPNRAESEYDTFGVGHSSTSISAALGMAIGNQMDNNDRRTVAVIGDGAMTAGMAFEALCHAGHVKSNMLVILNDNDMSISENVGGLSNYFARIWASRTYNRLREGTKHMLDGMPAARELARRTEEHMKGMVAPSHGTLFEELGFNYIGPIDGHDLEELLLYIEKLRDLPGPKLLHIRTQKGKGFIPAEKDPIGYHALGKIEPEPKLKDVKPAQPKPPKYSAVFGQWLCDVAEQDSRVVGITPAMREGSGMVEYSKRFPDRYHDVAIAEQHAVTLAAGLACEGQKPVVAIYSTFLQRGYDQLIHDVALQDLDVTFAIDRAGLVGEDGPTHNGAFDLSYLRCIPNMVIMAPSDENECRKLLTTGYLHSGPAAVRYPRGTGPGAVIESELSGVPIGKGVVRREGKEVAILAFGSMLKAATEAADALNATVVDMRFIKPLDRELILKMAAGHGLLVTIEENAVNGGAGSGVNELLAAEGVVMPILNLGLPDQFVEHGKPAEQLNDCGLSGPQVEQAIRDRLKLIAQQVPKSVIP